MHRLFLFLAVILCALNGHSLGYANTAPGALVPHTFTGLKEKFFPDFHAKYRNFSFPSARNSGRIGYINVSIEQHYRKNGAGVGSAVWEGASVLSFFLARHGAHIFRMCGTKRLNILEVGAGQALVSIVAGKLLSSEGFCQGGALLIATDGDANVLKQTRSNIARNVQTSRQVDISTQNLKWGNLHDMEVVERLLDKNAPLLILAADVVFELKSRKKNEGGLQTENALHGANHAFLALATTFAYFCESSDAFMHVGCVILLSYKKRRSRESAFFKFMSEKGFFGRRLKQRLIRPRRLRNSFQIIAFTRSEAALDTIDSSLESMFIDHDHDHNHHDL